MRKTLTLGLAYILSVMIYANDASFIMSGNHLVPVMETDISVTKEILKVKKISDNLLSVDVYYEFYNPRQAKKIIVGFEAASPDRGKDNVAPQYDWHPHMSNFTVNMNGARLPHKVTLVADSLYARNNEIVSLTRQQAIDVQDEETMSDAETKFNYVYYFDANFKEGVNVVRHTYNIELTGGVHYHYAFYYILTAAMRWGNKQIDDFTLIVDMGNIEDFYIDDAPFGDGSGWEMRGIGRIIQNAGFPWGNEYDDSEAPTKTRFYVRDGFLEYKSLNFRAKGELFIYSSRMGYGDNSEVFDYREYDVLPFSPRKYQVFYNSAYDDTSKRILRNLPFARRGYVFSNPEIRRYYLAQEWYMPDGDYKAAIESLTDDEKEWVKEWSN